MKTIFNKQVYRIIELFYNNKNQSLYLREISRKLKLNESSVSRYLNRLVKENTLITEKEGNLKKFYVNKIKISLLFPLFDYERFENLSLLRKNAIINYIKKSVSKPVFLVVFGSTAKKTLRKDSDLDILEIINKIEKKDKIINEVEAQTSIKIQLLQLTFNQFKKEIINKQDKVFQSALKTGFPVFNNKYYYEVMLNEWILLKTIT